jgi:hypothetical protein
MLVPISGVIRLRCFLDSIIGFINILFGYGSINDGFCCNQMIHELASIGLCGDINAGVFIELDRFAETVRI